MTTTPEQARRWYRRWLSAAFGAITTGVVMSFVSDDGRAWTSWVAPAWIVATPCLTAAAYWAGWLARRVDAVSAVRSANPIDPTLFPPLVCTLPAHHTGRTHTDGTASWTLTDGGRR